jgi:hypothetical protein
VVGAGEHDRRREARQQQARDHHPSAPEHVRRRPPYASAGASPSGYTANSAVTVQRDRSSRVS